MNAMNVDHYEMTGLIAKTGIIGPWDYINNNFSVEETDLNTTAAELLEEVAERNEYRDSKCHAIAEFSAEQLRLVTKHPNNRQTAFNTMLQKQRTSDQR